MKNTRKELIDRANLIDTLTITELANLVVWDLMFPKCIEKFYECLEAGMSAKGAYMTVSDMIQSI